MTTRNPRVFIVGTGPVASALAFRLRRAGVPVMGLWGRRAAAARAAASSAGVPAFAAAPPDIILESEVVIIAVSDAAIAEVGQMLAGSGMLTKRHVVLHCAGGLAASTALGAIAEKVAGIATMHPLRAVPPMVPAAKDKAVCDFRDVAFGIEGQGAGPAVATQLVASLGGVPLAIPDGENLRYHVGAVLAAGCVATMVESAVHLWASLGIDRGQAEAALLSLARGALSNLEAAAVPATITGPVKRLDGATVQAQIASLSANPALAAAYRATAVLGATRLAEAAATPDQAAAAAALAARLAQP